MVRCQSCGKTSQVVNSRPHSKTITKTRQYPNLQWGLWNGKRVRMCTSCIRTIAKRSRMHAANLKEKVT